MSSIINKSNHPVLIKKIPVQIWTVRDEIEFAISQRYIQQENPNIDDLKEYYSAIKKEEQTQSSDNSEEQESKNSDAEENKDTIQQIQRSASKENTYDGRLFLADISSKGTLLFSEKRYLPGQNIVIKFQVKEPFVLSAEVKNVHHAGRNSKIIQAKKFDYRISCEFSFLCEGEKEDLISFLRSIDPVIPPDPKQMKSTKSSEQEDDEEDFEDLGL
ncbi:MAG: hypothetical protein N4A33_02345 [Bacteriovoracaceae bacterium]|jgi:hypothetical protein|nr:hypothetical protein [Bacteriovoracaceae bacterium]